MHHIAKSISLHDVLSTWVPGVMMTFLSLPLLLNISGITVAEALALVKDFQIIVGIAAVVWTYSLGAVVVNVFGLIGDPMFRRASRIVEHFSRKSQEKKDKEKNESRGYFQNQICYQVLEHFKLKYAKIDSEGMWAILYAVSRLAPTRDEDESRYARRGFLSSMSGMFVILGLLYLIFGLIVWHVKFMLGGGCFLVMGIGLAIRFVLICGTVPMGNDIASHALLAINGCKLLDMQSIENLSQPSQSATVGTDSES